jgi:hypothetical protein
VLLPQIAERLKAPLPPLTHAPGQQAVVIGGFQLGRQGVGVDGGA